MTSHVFGLTGDNYNMTTYW